MVATSKSKRKAKKSSDDGRPVLYPEITALIARGPDALTEDKVKDLLGWQTEEGEEKFGVDYLLIDEEGHKVRCTNNVNNRPLYQAIVKNLTQEHLMQRWVFNGEPIIIGRTGKILNGQHTLVSFILACQIRNGESKNHWDEIWGKKTQLTLEKLVVFGVDESDNTVNTMDLCKPRSLADVIYRSEFFSTMKGKDRKSVSRLTDSAIRFLWYRMGVGSDPFAPRRTHSEALDFLMRHPSVLKAVKHVFDENTEQSITRYIAPGTASALLYLMAASDTDGDVYRNADKHSEEIIDLDNFDKAYEFWVKLSINTNEEMKELRHAIGSLADPDTGLGGSTSEKVAILVLAWNLFKAGEKITRKALKLEYFTDDEGINHLTTYPDLGGIDFGDPKGEKRSAAIAGGDDDDADEPVIVDAVEDDEEAAEAPAPKKRGRKPAVKAETTHVDPTPAQIEEAKVAERKKRAADIAAKLQAKRKASVAAPEEDQEEDDTVEEVPEFKPIKGKGTSPAKGKSE